METSQIPAGIPARWALASLQRLLLLCCLCVGALLTIPLALAASPMAETTAKQPNPSRRAELITLVRQDCGSCHGLTLKGGLGPALLPATLKDKPASSLQATILFGRPGTAMPPWQRFLSEAEAAWIVAQLQKGFPDEK
ncbi:c-type cytochrome [Undibacterium sp. Ren11W]|uniref:c-type cytochrome n=1 Tax=Undibacterium sp. Ren11W TaxID=3413045 RepID=UPI003BF0F999